MLRLIGQLFALSAHLQRAVWIRQICAPNKYIVMRWVIEFGNKCTVHRLRVLWMWAWLAVQLIVTARPRSVQCTLILSTWRNRVGQQTKLYSTLPNGCLSAGWLTVKRIVWWLYADCISLMNAVLTADQGEPGKSVIRVIIVKMSITPLLIRSEQTLWELQLLVSG